MNKKNAVITSVVTTAMLLGGCAMRQPISTDHVAYQSGPSAKLDAVHHHAYPKHSHLSHCKHKHR